MLLGILEVGMLTLGDNSTTDFTRSIILMISNVGSRDMDEFLERRPVGFHPESNTSTSDGDTIRDLASERRKSPNSYSAYRGSAEWTYDSRPCDGKRRERYYRKAVP